MKMYELLKYNGCTWIIVTLNLKTHITSGLALYSGKRHFNKEHNNVTVSTSFLFRRSIMGQIY